MRAACIALAAIAAATRALAGPVWFTDGATVVRWLHDAGTFDTPGESTPVAAIAPTADGGAWVLRGATLTRLTAEMARVAAVDVTAESWLPRM